MGLGAGFAMALMMAMEAMMMKVVCMMNGLIGLGCWTMDGDCI